MRNYVLCATSLLSAALAVFADNNSPYGVCAHVTRNEFSIRGAEYRKMAEAGIRWVRSDFDWSAMQNAAGEWDFGKLDQLIGDAEKAGITILPILGYNSPKGVRPNDCLEDWDGYVKTLVSRYGERLPVLELWNEENIPGFWKDPDPVKYTELLKRTYAAVKSTNPKIKVMFGGTAGVPFEFIEQCYRAGAAKSFDIMNIHPYSHPAPPENRLENEIVRLREIMAKYGDGDKPLWITEIGWPTQHRKTAVPGMLKCGLSIANPEKKGRWNVLVIEEYDAEVPEMAEVLVNELPGGTAIRRCAYADVNRILQNYSFDAVVLPFNENYPADAEDALVDYVKNGGTLVEFGGFPLYYGLTTDSNGKSAKAKTNPADFRNRLRLGVEAWWLGEKGKVPEKMVCHPTDQLKGIQIDDKGIEGTRFLVPDLLKEGDRFIPLLQGKLDSYTGTAAAVYKFNSDFKGALVVSTVFERSNNTNTELKQSKTVTRANLIAFSKGVERIFWYEFQAPETDPYDPESFFGITHRDLSPKPAYSAYQALIRLRPSGSVPLSGVHWKTDDEKVYQPQWKRPDGTIAGALWSVDRPGIYRATFKEGDVRIVNHLGAEIMKCASGKPATVSISNAPIYFYGAQLEKIEPVPVGAAELPGMLPAIFARAGEQYLRLAARMESYTNAFPRRIDCGRFVTVAPTEWTSGFFPGSLWLLYEATGNDKFRSLAKKYTDRLEQIRHFTGNHDIGFMLMCSAGNGYRLADIEGYREILLDGAAALCTRYNEKMNLIRSWNGGHFQVIIDNMMNLELLMWASKHGGDPKFAEIARKHADTTNRRHFRADDSAFHVIDYNPDNGKIYQYVAGQGASADSPWARGQSWGLYGFTMMYRETKNPAYLARAVRSAEFLTGHKNLPPDLIPYWDYEAAAIPNEPRDTSAGAIMCSALFELCQLVESPQLAKKYRDFAIRQLLSLVSPEYFAEVGSNGNFLLKHGVGHLPGNSEIDVPLNYGDYYLLEALLRFRKLSKAETK
ncbi:MAG: glycoside hydrolase family 88 protein [Kiritimatiellae bacterium]|nr:glycoside hydrolase family 88 protein [Kiritimatiellia bacterium]